MFMVLCFIGMCMWAIVVHVAVLTISEQRAVGIMGFRNIAMEPFQAPSVPHRSHKMVGQAPYLRATLPEGTQVQVWPDVISQSSPHLFSTSLPVITSCPIQIKAFFFLSCVNCVKIFDRVNGGRLYSL